VACALPGLRGTMRRRLPFAFCLALGVLSVSAPACFGSRELTFLPVAGEECNIDGMCADGHLCAYGDDEVGTCWLLVGLGEECSRYIRCAHGGVCLSTVEPRRCAPPLEDGETCTSVSDCAQDLGCNTAYDPPRCARRDTPGVLCKNENDSSNCSGPLTCNVGFDPPSCQPDQPVGGPCFYPTNCESFACDEALGICVE
jgi:hypothetical protein